VPKVGWDTPQACPNHRVMRRKGQQMREKREKPGKEAMRRHTKPKPPAASRKGNTVQLQRRSHRGQTERGSKACWDAEQGDRHWASRWSTRIARQPFFPAEAIPGALGTGKRVPCRSGGWAGRACGRVTSTRWERSHWMHARRCLLRLQSRKTDWRRTGHCWMHQHTHLARL
jgi:hypothetical protein